MVEMRWNSSELGLELNDGENTYIMRDDSIYHRLIEWLDKNGGVPVSVKRRGTRRYEGVSIKTLLMETL